MIHPNDVREGLVRASGMPQADLQIARLMEALVLVGIGLLERIDAGLMTKDYHRDRLGRF